MYELEVIGLAQLKLGDMRGVVKTAAQRSINRTADRARTQTAREIRQQVAFPANYLSPQGGRLAVVQRASGAGMEARVRARFRATSLARFITSESRAMGIRVAVKPGSVQELPKAFLIRLRPGVDSQGNRAVAIRLKPGQTLRNKKTAKKMASGLYILYGPSVYQVARHVFEDVSHEWAAFMEAEFQRQMRLLT